MAKREVNGTLDLTNLPGEKHLSDVSGETIGGTTTDDLFDEHTEWLPDDVDEDDLSESQKEAVKAFLAHSDRENVSFEELAEGHDRFTKQGARRGIHKVFRDYRGFEDLFGSHQLAVLIWAHHGTDASAYSLAEQYPISRTVLGNARRTYPDLIEEKQPLSEEKLEEGIGLYLENHPSKREEYRSGDDESTDSNGTQKTSGEKEWPDDFSPCQRWFIETITDDPTLSSWEVGEMIPVDDGEQRWSNANYHNVVKSYGELIAELIAEKESVSEISELNDYLQDNIPVSAITDLDGLATGSNPEPNPDGSGQANGDGYDDDSGADNEIEDRLRAVESKVENLRQELEQIEQPEQTGGQNDLAQLVVESLSDEQLGQILRGAMTDE